MPTDITGTPSTNYGLPKYATTVDKPSGAGFNGFVDFLDSFLVNSASLLGAVARTVIKKAGSTIGTRRAINFIEGSNVTITVADDAVNEEVDVTIAASVSASSTSVRKNGSPVGTRANLNLIEGNNIILTAADDAANSEVDVTVALIDKIIRGQVNADGTLRYGSGFTSSKTGTGLYTVTFTNAFATGPACVAVPEDSLAIITIMQQLVGSVSFRTADASNPGTVLDKRFHFIAIGT